MERARVFVQKLKERNYPYSPPFHPHIHYPEYIFPDLSLEYNHIYVAIRNLFHLMELDNDSWNTKHWNPFKDFIKPGNKILIKPNMVIDDDYNQECITTNTSIIRTIIDYVIIALKGSGEIFIGDAPLQSCNFKKLTAKIFLQDVIKYYKNLGYNIQLFDFRTEKMVTKYSYLTKTKRNLKIIKLKGDPNGYKIIDLGEKSNLFKISQNNGYKKFRVTNYEHTKMSKAHNEKNHKYLISNSVIQSDVVINLPKIKAHRKAGITGCLKNTVGINGYKDWLPHHKKGSKIEGGDEFLKKNPIKNLHVKIIEKEDNFLIKSPGL